jgi:hypothetical protein
VHFILPSGDYDKLPCPRRNTAPLLKLGYKFSDTNIWKNQDVIVFPPEYFCPIEYSTKKVIITENTYSIHHYLGLWISNDERELNAKIEAMEAVNTKLIAFFKRQNMKYHFAINKGEVSNIFEYFYRKIYYKIYRFKRRSSFYE